MENINKKIDKYNKLVIQLKKLNEEIKEDLIPIFEKHIDAHREYLFGDINLYRGQVDALEVNVKIVNRFYNLHNLDDVFTIGKIEFKEVIK